MIRSRIPYFPQSQFNIRRYVELHFLHPFSTKREHCLRVTASKRWLKFVLHCHLLHQDVCRYLNLYPDKDCIWAPEFWFHLSTFHRGGEVVGRRTCIPQNPIFAMQPFQPLFSEADFLTENYDEIFQLLEVGKGSLQLVTIDGMGVVLSGPQHLEKWIYWHPQNIMHFNCWKITVPLFTFWSYLVL